MAARRSRSRCIPAPRTRGVVSSCREGVAADPARAEARPASVSRGRSRRSARSRNALLALRRVLGAGEDLACPDECLLPVVRPLELDPDAVVDVALGGAESARERVGRIGGVLSLRQRDDAHVEALPDRKLHPSQRCLLSRGVGVEAEEQSLREAAELAQLALGERGAHRGDDGLDPGLPEGDDVGVALDHDRAILLRDGSPRQVQAIEHVALLEELALGGVDVLPSQRIVVAELARLEADDPPPRIREREHQPEREVVVATGVREARGLHLLDGEASLARLRDEPGSRARDRDGTRACSPPRVPRPARYSRTGAPASVSQSIRSKYAVACSRRAVSRSRRCRAASSRGDDSSYSSGTRNRSASHSIAPTKSRFSVSWTKRTTSPPLPQPKQ